MLAVCEFDTTPIAATKWVMAQRPRYPPPGIGQQLLEQALTLLLSFARKGPFVVTVTVLDCLTLSVFGPDSELLLG